MRRDTVAYVHLPSNRRPSAPGEGTRAFETGLQWAVGIDGRIAILYRDPYSVSLVHPNGSVTRGPQIPFSRVRPREADKEWWMGERARPRPVMIMKPGDAAPTAGLRAMVVIEPVQWPTHLPPFLENAALFAPDGTLWVQRYATVGSPQLFDVLDGRGVLVGRVSTLAPARLAAFGRRHVYIVVTDPDGQEFLERHPFVSIYQ
jgi:hypothetical protein